MRERVPLFFGLALLAIAVVVGSLFIAGGIRDRNRADVDHGHRFREGADRLRLHRLGRQLDWSGASPAAASAQLSGWTSRVRGFFREQDVVAEELTVEPISTESPGSVDQNGARVTGYRLTRSFEIRSSRVALIAAVAERSSSLLAQGVPLAADAPQYIYTKLRGLRPRLLAAATKDAQSRARVLVAASTSAFSRSRARTRPTSATTVSTTRRPFARTSPQWSTSPSPSLSLQAAHSASQYLRRIRRRLRAHHLRVDVTEYTAPSPLPGGRLLSPLPLAQSVAFSR
jgi:uncharacterized protein